MRGFALGAVLLAAASLAGCASGGHGELTGRERLASVSHWHDLARVVAAQVAERLGGAPELRARPVFVAGSHADAPFSRAFHGFLATALHNHGVALAASPDGALVLDWRSEVVVHQGEVTSRADPTLFTALAAAAALPLIVGEAGAGPRAAIALSLGTAAALDANAGLDFSGDSAELAVFTWLRDGGHMVWRAAETFAIAAADQNIYHRPREPVRIAW